MTVVAGGDEKESAPSVGLYIHIPFCERVCPYCDFAVVQARPVGDEREERYVEALLRELERREPLYRGRELASIYLGGGTPSLLRPQSLARLLRGAFDLFPAAAPRTLPAAGEAVEITLEVNPSTLERGRLPAFREIGVNRVSIGIQSFDDATLRRLGRAHHCEEGVGTLEAARAAGFGNLSLDLIAAAPGQSLEGFEADLDRALGFAPEHLSIYELTIETGTPFELADRRGQLARAGEDDIARMFEALVARGRRAGLERYEISNHARPGYESVHNSRYWSREPVLGIGVGAWSSEPRRAAAPFGGRRANTRDLSEYLDRVEAGESPEVECDVPSESQARGEAMFLGLRRNVGVSAERFAAEFGAAPRSFHPEVIERLLASGLLIEEPETGNLRLSDRGQLLSDTVFAEFV